MLKLISFWLILSWITIQTNPQSVQSGKCPYVPSVQNFNLGRFSGTWYSISRIPVPSLKLGKCIVLNFVIDSSNIVRISINHYDGSQIQQLNNAFTINNSSGVYFINVPMVALSFELIVIDTDYNGYAVIYGCSKLATLKIEIIWILSRQPTLAKNIYKNALFTLKQLKLPFKKLKTVNQTNCPRYY